MGDRIVAIEGERMEDFRDVQDSIMLYPGRTLDVTVERDGAERIFEVPVRSVEMEDRFGNVSKVGLIGIASGAASFDFEPQGPIAALGLAVDHSLGIVAQWCRDRADFTVNAQSRNWADDQDRQVFG